MPSLLNRGGKEYFLGGSLFFIGQFFYLQDSLRC